MSTNISKSNIRRLKSYQKRLDAFINSEQYELKYIDKLKAESYYISACIESNKYEKEYIEPEGDIIIIDRTMVLLSKEARNIKGKKTFQLTSNGFELIPNIFGGCFRNRNKYRLNGVGSRSIEEGIYEIEKTEETIKFIKKWNG